MPPEFSAPRPDASESSSDFAPVKLAQTIKYTTKPSPIFHSLRSEIIQGLLSLPLKPEMDAHEARLFRSAMIVLCRRLMILLTLSGLFSKRQKRHLIASLLSTTE